MVVWIDCRDHKSIARSFVTLAELLNINTNEKGEELPSLEDLKHKTYVHKVKHSLQQHKTLIVYDNCNDWDTIQIIYRHFYPAGIKVRAIITTQRPERTWNRSEIPAASYTIQQYAKEATIKFMCEVLYPKSALPYKEQEFAAEIYSMYGGTPIFISLIVHYIHQRMTLGDYCKKFKGQLMSNPAIKKEDIPLFMIFSGLDEASMFVMQVLAITNRVNHCDFLHMNYLVPQKSQTKAADFKLRFARLIDMSLLNFANNGINIAHEIIQKYLINTMTPDDIETVVDKWFEEAKFIAYSPRILAFYLERNTLERTLCKTIEVAGIWKDTFSATSIARKETITAAKPNYPHHFLLLKVAISQKVTKEEFTVLKDAFTYFQQNLGESNIISLLAEYFLLCVEGNAHRKLHQKIKAIGSNLPKFHTLTIFAHLEYGVWLQNNQRVAEAIEELNRCYTNISTHIPHNSTLLFQAKMHLIEAHIKSNAESAQSMALDLMKKVAYSEMSLTNYQFPLAARLVVQCQSCKQSQLPKLLYQPSTSLHENSEGKTLQLILEDRRLGISQSGLYATKFLQRSLVDTNVICLQLNKSYQVSVGQYAVVLWSTEYLGFEREEEPFPFFIAFLNVRCFFFSCLTFS